jgi:hypothetical protein
MKFFLPDHEDKKLVSDAYGAIKKLAKRTTGWDVTNRKINYIKYCHKGRYYEAKVGERETQQGELVIAILESTVAFLVCTRNRGVSWGMPMLVGKTEVTSIKDFDK